MKEVKIPSAVPVYGFAGAVLLYNLILPMYRLSDLLICLGVGCAVFLILKKRFPGTVKQIEEPEPQSGDPALDEAIRQGREAADELRRLNERIPDEAISADLADMERLTAQIFDQVRKEPEKLPKIRQMMTYYLPTTIGLLKRYAELQGQAEMPNVKKALEEIRRAVHSIREAFRRQLDSLYEHDVIDITAEIQVMEQMLRTNGLTPEREFEMKKEF